MPPNNTEAALPEPWNQPWPADGLEAVDACPACGGIGRSLLHEALVDNTFRTARGHWTMWRCATCASGYLSPRPSAATIHEAYQRYYTHGHVAVEPPKPAPLQELRLRMANGYTNWRFGSKRVPASGWGIVAALLLPSRRDALDRAMRHLPRRSDRGGKLLDVGCGDGAFLAEARKDGWQVLGLEPDSTAAQRAREGGVDVIVGGLERLEGQFEAFDAITLCHVIEHVHEPVKALRACHRLLKPGGQLWIQTPNVNALGHRVFGGNWRGLEPPRHLAVFSARALDLALRQAGFARPTTLPSPSPRRWIFERSQAMSIGRWPDEPTKLPPALERTLLGADLREVLDAREREFLTVSALRTVGCAAA